MQGILFHLEYRDRSIFPRSAGWIGAINALRRTHNRTCAEWDRYISGFRETRSKTSVVPLACITLSHKVVREGENVYAPFSLVRNCFITSSRTCIGCFEILLADRPRCCSQPCGGQPYEGYSSNGDYNWEKITIVAIFVNETDLREIFLSVDGRLIF